MSKQEEEGLQESIKHFDEGRLLKDANPQIGDLEFLSFPESRLKHQLIGMFSPEIQRTCRIRDIYQLPRAEKDDRVFRVVIEKRYE